MKNKILYGNLFTIYVANIPAKYLYTTSNLDRHYRTLKISIILIMFLQYIIIVTSINIFLKGKFLAKFLK